MLKYRYLFFAIIVTAIASLAPKQTSAQGMNNAAWSPQVQNRASVAALIRQVEEGDASSGSISVSDGTTGGITQLVCGADATTSAKGNSSCIILNNADASIDLGQDSVGDQNSTSESTQTTNVDETINTGADDVLAVLNGDE